MLSRHLPIWCVSKLLKIIFSCKIRDARVHSLYSDRMILGETFSSRVSCWLSRSTTELKAVNIRANFVRRIHQCFYIKYSRVWSVNMYVLWCDQGNESGLKFYRCISLQIFWQTADFTLSLCSEWSGVF